MRSLRVKLTVRQMMGLVAVAAMVLGLIDFVRMSIRVAEYRRRANSAERMERRCREIVAMDPAIRADKAEAAMDNPFLLDPEWTRRMIPWFESVKKKYREAALHPRAPVAPDPPHP
ncbi:hypothetical protein [Paludisphaera rhizosphaerae]|uniref:hypothetical protein n=1 Tax=Paludisphaera rhizosphaerae TaxID=2711216 RepID=UPI0013EE3415|nr:hypothetical protein [Paludisphaera rhizosphaerae]